MQSTAPSVLPGSRSAGEVSLTPTERCCSSSKRAAKTRAATMLLAGGSACLRRARRALLGCRRSTGVSSRSAAQPMFDEQVTSGDSPSFYKQPANRSAPSGRAFGAGEGVRRKRKRRPRWPLRNSCSEANAQGVGPAISESRHHHASEGVERQRRHAAADQGIDPKASSLPSASRNVTLRTPLS
ncbi:MAG: hypothetical protein QOF68_679 [Gaiellales bacterium]|jgi:hypothetical protein|nr:hypothetical protein [Gaiellales bacterium]